MRTLQVTETAGPVAKVAITIDGRTTPYEVTRHHGWDAGTDEFEWMHEDNENLFITHVVRTHRDGSATCSCPDHQHRGHVRPCKHVAATRRLIEKGVY